MVQPRRDTSEASLTSVAKMIDTAFGNDEDNVVDFGSIHAILLILARSLCVLDREVAVKLPYTQTISLDDKITINELKISVKDERKIEDQNEFEKRADVPDHKPTKLKFSPGKASKQFDQNNDGNTKNNVFTTQIFYVVAEKASSSKQQKISNKRTVASISGNTYKEHVFPEKYMISSEAESIEYIKKKYKKDMSNDLSTHTPKKSPDVKGKRAKLTGTTETHQEKILVVDRRPSIETMSFKSKVDQSLEQTPQTLVTREQYNRLKDDVMKLQQQYDTIDPIYHERTSLSNPVAVLQISARLEVVEGALREMQNLLSIATVSPLTPDNILLKNSQKWQSKIEDLKHLAKEGMKENLGLLLNIRVLSKDQRSGFSTILYEDDSKVAKTSKNKTEDTTKISKKHDLSDTGQDNHLERTDVPVLTFEELRYRTTKFSEEMAKTAQKLIYSVTLRAEATLQNQTIIGGRLTKILQNLPCSTLEALENKVNDFINKVNKTDVTLSKITTEYYEELVELETDIIIKLENLAEVTSRQFPENDDIPELANKFSLFLNDIQETNACQDELDFKQSKLFDKIEIARKKLCELQSVKANRADVEKEIDSKVSLCDINGIVSMIHFFAILGNWEKHIKNVFDNIRGQEIHWQEHISALWTKIDEKLSFVHIVNLTQDFKKHTDMLNEKLDFMLDLCNSYKIEKNTAVRVLKQESCICCDAVEKENGRKRPTQPQQQVNAKTSNVTTHRSNHDKPVCYPNTPISNTLEKRAETCGKCVGVLKTITNIQFNTDSLTSTEIVRSSSRGTTSILKHKDVITPCKECNEPKHEIITLAPVKDPKPKARKAKSFKQINHPIESQKTTRESFASQKSKRSCASSGSSKRSLAHEHFRDSVTEESDEEPVLIILDDD